MIKTLILLIYLFELLIHGSKFSISLTSITINEQISIKSVLFKLEIIKA
jgi:hypothetical protein